jgi:hypothetical protein
MVVIRGTKVLRSRKLYWLRHKSVALGSEWCSPIWVQMFAFPIRIQRIDFPISFCVWFNISNVPLLRSRCGGKDWSCFIQSTIISHCALKPSLVLNKLHWRVPIILCSRCLIWCVMHSIISSLFGTCLKRRKITLLRICDAFIGRRVIHVIFAKTIALHQPWEHQRQVQTPNTSRCHVTQSRALVWIVIYV